MSIDTDRSMVCCRPQELLTISGAPIVSRASLFVPFELEAAGERSPVLDLLDRPFGGPVVVPSFGGRQVEGLSLAF